MINRFLSFFTPRRTRRLAAGLTAAFFLVVFLTARADAAFSEDIVVGIFTTLNLILFALIQTVGKIISLLIQLLVAISSYNKFTTVRVVDIGWTIVKDVSNMLFIIALLVIAAGTVLRLENYRYNRLLSNLIIMAFLANFSKFIAAFLIQGAQVLMLTFVNAYKDAMFGNFVSLFGIDSVLKFDPDAPGIGLEPMAIFGNMLGSLILMIVAFVVTVAICIVLVARIVALWILVIMSPFAFASQILPNTKAFASRWWSEFGKYVSQGPILAFFLWLALAIVNVGGGASSVDEEFGIIATNVAGSQESANFFAVNSFSPDNLITFIISTAFLMFGLQYATSTSGAVGRFAKDFATGKTGVSPMSFIRDRTVAPVQGWIRNRGAARSAAIQERSQTLEAAGDRLRARLPGRVGAEKAQAAAAAYERQRTQRVAQSRGFSDMGTSNLQQIMATGRDPRERLAALQTLQARGAIDLSQKPQRQAFENVLANQRIPGADRKKLREDLLGNYAKGLNGDQLRDELKQTDLPKEDRITFARRLQEVGELKANQPGDEGIVRNLRADLAETPDKLRAFDESLMKTNQDMAKKVLFNDLATSGDRRNLLLAVQQKQISASSLNKEAQKKFADAGEKGAIAQHSVENSRDEATLRGLYSQMDPEAAREIFSHVDMRGEASLERRAMVARVTGEMGKAFTDSTNTYMEPEALAYANKLSGEELARNISVDSLKDEKVLKTLNSSDNMKFPHWETIRNRNKETRTALTEGLGKYADQLAVGSPDGKLDLDPKNKENNFVALNLALASKGKVLRHDLKSDSGQRAYESMVRGGKAADLADLNESAAFQDPDMRPYMTKTYGLTADPAKIADMLQFENYDFAAESLKAAEKELLDRISNGDMKAYSRLSQMARNPVLSEFVSTPEKPGKSDNTAAAVLPYTQSGSPGEQQKKDEQRPEKTRPSDDYKRTRAGFRRDQDNGPDTGGAPTPPPLTPPPPRGPSGAPQNILIANLNPEQRQARQEVINIRRADNGKIDDVKFSELAQQILKTEDLNTYRELSRVPAQILSDDDRQLLQEFNTQLGLRGSDVQNPSDYLTPAQTAARQQVVDTRQKNNGRITDDQLKQLGETIIGSDQFADFQRLAKQPSQGLSDADRELLKDLSIRLGYREPGT